jgi:hypothetical protein
MQGVTKVRNVQWRYDLAKQNKHVSHKSPFAIFIHPD